MLTTLLLLATGLEHRIRFTRYEGALGGSREALQLHHDGDRSSRRRVSLRRHR